MSGEKCKCDACDVEFGAHDARSPDGYCAFCGKNCYPLSRLGAREVRVALGETSRENLHAMARVAESAQENVLRNPSRIAETARQEAAEAAVRLLGPLVERGGKVLIKRIRDKIKGT